MKPVGEKLFYPTLITVRTLDTLDYCLAHAFFHTLFFGVLSIMIQNF